MFVTSYARRNLIKAIDDNMERFIYCDTDSVYLLGWEEPKLQIHDTEFGKWAMEGKFVKGKFIRSKCYIIAFIASVAEQAVTPSPL